MEANYQKSNIGIKWYAEIMLLFVAVVWGASYGLAKTAVLFYPVLGFLAIRFCSTSLILAPSLFRLSKNQIINTLKIGLPLGSILLLIFISETYGVSLTLASNSAFLISLCVVFTPFVEWFVLKTKPKNTMFTATLISVLGTWLLTSGVSIDFNIGDGLIILAAILRAIMVTYTNKLTKNKKISSLALTCIQTGVVGFGCLLLSLLLLPDGLPELPKNHSFWYATIFLVCFCTLFAFFAQNYALKHTNPTRVSLLMGSEPIFGALFAVYFLNEQLSIIGWIGGFMIVGASMWAAFKRN